MAIYWFWFHYPTCRNVQRPHCTVHESAWCASLPVRTLKISISFPLTLISFHKNKFLLKAKKQEETTSASSVTLDKAVRTTIRLNLNYPESVKTNPPTLTKIDHNSSEIKKKIKHTLLIWMQQGKRVKHHGESGKYDKIPQNERTGVNGLK